MELNITESFEKQLSEYLLNPPLEHQLEDLLNSDNPSVNQVKKLIEAGVDVNVRFEDDTPAIALAASSGRLEIVKVLIEAGADVNAYGETGEFALGSATGSGWQDVYDYLLPLTNVKLRKNAELHILDGKKSQAYRDQQINQPIEIEFANACFAGDIAVIRDLISQGYQIDAPDLVGNTPLYRAAFYQAPLSVQTLLAFGANPNIQCEGGRTPLISSISIPPLLNDGANQKEILKLLIEAGADLNLRSEDGRTALMEIVLGGASSEHIKELISLLVNAGADTEIVDKYDNTAILLAASSGKHDIVDYLKLFRASDQNLNQIYLILASEKGDTDAVKQFIKSGININAKDQVGNTSLMYAAWYGYENIVNALLEKNSDLDIQGTLHRSALLLSISSSHFTIATSLINAGANIHLIDKQGYNSLTLAKSFLPSKNLELKNLIKLLKERFKQ
jgi:uncharacterized protein